MAIPGVRDPNIVAEGERVALLANQQGIALRLLGGVAINIACGTASALPELRRTYNDIDFAASKRVGKAVASLLTSQGYEPNSRFNALHGHSRLLFHDILNARQVDVFLGSFEMCHKLDLEPRLTAPGHTLPLSDLLLLKLQVVELNHKDVVDALTILLEYEPVSEDRHDAISLRYISTLTASDWGWYTTLSDNLATVFRLAADTLTTQHDVMTVQERIDALVAAMAEAPKSLPWRMRDKVGRRKAWYQLPEEVAR